MDALTFLGTGCGWPMTDRFHSSLLLEEGGRRWLLDAGEPCSHRLKAMGVPFDSLDAVFISHGHSDHLSGLPMLIQGAWLEGRGRPLPIYLPRELVAPVKMWLDAVYLPEKLIGFPLEYHDWEPLGGRPVAVDGGRLQVSVNPTSHLDGLRAMIDAGATDRFLAYSIVFDWQNGKRLIYSADLGKPEDMDALWTQPCDLLVCELAHFTPEQLFLYLRGKPLRRLVMTHPALEFSAETVAIEALAAKMLPGLGKAAVMRDGSRVEF